MPGLIFAFDLKDGREVWREALVADQPLAASDDLLFVPAGEAIHALRQSDGKLAWRRPTGTATAPLLAKDGWVIAAAGTKLFALRATDGSVVWSVDAGPQRTRAAIEGDVLYVPFADGWLRAVDLATGTVRWQRRFSGSPAEPLIVGDRIYFGATDKNFYCVDLASGEVDWPIRVGAAVRGGAATDGDRVFFAGLDNLVRAVDRGNGSQRWQRGVPFRPFSGPVVAGSSVLIAGRTADIRQLNPLNGKESGKITFPEPLAIAPAVAVVPEGLAVAGITGGLSESWKLWLAVPTAKPKPGSDLDFSIAQFFLRNSRVRPSGSDLDFSSLRPKNRDLTPAGKPRNP